MDAIALPQKVQSESPGMGPSVGLKVSQIILKCRQDGEPQLNSSASQILRTYRGLMDLAKPQILTHWIWGEA
jgi:hypothetical protein